jgi:hypothetical protein
MKLGGNIGTASQPLYVVIDEFNGKRFIDVRKYFINSDDEEIATRKGIKINPTQFIRLVELLSDNHAIIIEKLSLDSASVKTAFTNLNVIPNSTLKGRIFSVDNLNGRRDVVISSEFLDKIDGDIQLVVGKMISSLFEALNDTIDDDTLVNDILDRWSQLLQLQTR